MNARDGASDGNTPLLVALYNGNRDAAMLLLRGFFCACSRADYRADPRKVRNPLIKEPLCSCAVKPLNANLGNDHGFAAIHVASRRGDVEFVKTLV